MWMYKIHLTGQVWRKDGTDYFVDETPFEIPQFDLQNKDLIQAIVKQRYVDVEDASQVQVILHKTWWSGHESSTPEEPDKKEVEQPKTASVPKPSFADNLPWYLKVIWWLIKLPFRIIWWFFG